MSIMPYPPGQDPRTAFLSRPRPDWPEEEPDPDAVVDDLRWRWRRGSFPPPVPGFDLAGGVGRGTRNARADVARLETLLHRAGHYDVSGTGGPTGYFGPPQEDAIRAYQKARGLTVDGLVLPNGETMAALAREPEAPPPDGQPEADAGTDEATGSRAPPDQEANAGAIIGGGALVGTALVGNTLWQQEQERQRKAGKPPRGINLLDGLKRLSPKPGNGVTKAGPLPWQLPGFDPPDMNLPNQTGAPPAKLPDTNKEVLPAADPEPPLPPLIPSGQNPDHLVEIFPDQSGDLPQGSILENRKGSERIIGVNTSVIERLLKGRKAEYEHENGARDADGVGVKEAYLPRNEKAGSDGASYTDGTIKHAGTNRRLHFNTYDTWVDGETPVKREGKAELRIILNKKDGDVFIMIPKPRPGQEINMDELERRAKPFMDELARQYEPGRFEGSTRLPGLLKQPGK